MATKEARRLYILVNSLAELTFGALLPESLPGVEVTVGESFPQHPRDYHLVLLWSVRRLVREAVGCPNTIVFHSSDLPQGRGWAPLYHAVADGLPRYTITGFRPVHEVDAGDVVVKASFRIQPDHTAEILRAFDRRIILQLAAAVLERFPDGVLAGAPQVGTPSQHRRRRPEDNEVSLDRTLGSLLPHLRACEPGHPAFLMFQGVRYDIKVTPVPPPSFPSDVEVVFMAEGTPRERTT
jgi:methionyl-tRNA formyltransferase